MTTEKQAKVLKQLAAGRAMPRLQAVLWLLAAGLAAAAGVMQHLAYFIVALLAAVAAWSSRQAAPYVRRAARALEQGSRSPGGVRIEITEWSESRTFHATVTAPDARPWRFEFTPPGWTPAEGLHDAEIFMLPGTPWPALLRTSQGLLHPRSRPQPAPATSPATRRPAGRSFE